MYGGYSLYLSLCFTEYYYSAVDIFLLEYFADVLLVVLNILKQLLSNIQN